MHPILQLERDEHHAKGSHRMWREQVDNILQFTCVAHGLYLPVELTVNSNRLDHSEAFCSWNVDESDRKKSRLLMADELENWKRYSVKINCHQLYLPPTTGSTKQATFDMRKHTLLPKAFYHWPQLTCRYYTDLKTLELTISPVVTINHCPQK